MEAFYWIFILSAVTATFFVIFKKLSRETYWTIAILALLYLIVLSYSLLTGTR
ncbi:hypothetical protein JF544_17345 [Halobacillus kuroshimensis]|uniref:Uncharacterized protein n=1 Tax=Halobacillus kuroshimensis TaxID=302481 RepID=A0ABS3E094_9BACI|nr:hypothetical protein [Halobacillus kuroshimensis]MBN8237025.1 hypothetical protein [Halobacillus kuroshimensis]